MEDLSSGWSVILVRPRFPENIGAAARAMKTMGLADLRVVRGAPFRQIDAARRMARGAAEILDWARVYEGLEAALEDRQHAIATTHRLRSGRFDEVALIEDRLEDWSARARDGQRLALVFGPEDTGLSRDELLACSEAVTIPTASPSLSLNLAQAVMVCGYLITRQARGSTEEKGRQSAPLPTLAEGRRLARRLASLAIAAGLKPRGGREELFARSLERSIARGSFEQGDLAALHQLARFLERRLPEARDDTPS